MTQDSQPQRKSHWAQWVGWLAGGLALTANAIGVIEVATAHRLLLSLIAGLLAIVGGGVWLWRLSGGQARPARMRAQIFILNLAMVVIGAGVVGTVLARQWQEPAKPSNQGSSLGSEQGLDQSLSQGPVIPSGSIQPPLTPGATLFTGSIKFRYPQSGNTLMPGQSVGGEVTNWVAGYQVWLSTQPEGGRETIHGRCTVQAPSWTCTGMRLEGHPGILEHLLVVVVADAIAAQLDGATELPVPSAVGYDQVAVYKGG